MIIGLYGYSRAGKDTVAGCLVRNHGFEQRNMAGPIRDVLLKINPPVNYYAVNSEEFFLSEAVEELGWDEVKALFPQTVDWMIQLGQSMRDIDPSIWLNACTGQPYENLVIADVRQPNEYEYISQHGGEVWNIRSERAQKRGMDGILDDYYFEHIVNNDGTISELESYIEEIMEKR